MVIEYAGGELFNYIVEVRPAGKGHASPTMISSD